MEDLLLKIRWNINFIGEETKKVDGSPEVKDQILNAHELFVDAFGKCFEVDVDKEKERLEKDIASFKGRIKAVNGKLNNPNFVSRAPEQVVEHERKKIAGYEETLALLKENYKKLIG